MPDIQRLPPMFPAVSGHGGGSSATLPGLVAMDDDAGLPKRKIDLAQQFDLHPAPSHGGLR